MKLRLHVGSGNVYLRDWINVDLPMRDVFLASERPDLVEKYITVEEAYYSRHSNKKPETLKVPVRTENICDRFGSFSSLPCRSGEAAEILSRQVFEHLSPENGVIALRECARVLEPGGILRIDVPDPDETLRRFAETRDSFWIRHLFGPRRNEYGGHTPYTRQMLTTMAFDCGFRYICEEPNIHEFYPAFCLRFCNA